MDDTKIINAQRIEALRSRLLTKAEELIEHINTSPEESSDHEANGEISATVAALVEAFTELR